MKYNFSKLIKKLKEINFTNLTPLIKFTFDVDKVLKQISRKEFSIENQKLCQINYDRMITQKQVYQSTNFSNIKGFCVLVSIYNAFEGIFKTFNDFIAFVRYIVSNHLKYSSMSDMVNIINTIKCKTCLLKDENNLRESYSIFCNNIDKNKPIVISYQFQNDNVFIPKFGQHAVTLVGYDDNFIYYIENSEDDYLFTSLAIYVYLYYKFKKLDQNHVYYTKLSELINQVTQKDIYNSAKKLLGYNVLRDNIRTIKKEFLTNTEYFYDLNGLITYSEEIPKYYEDNCSNQLENFDFSEYLDQINNMNW